MVSYTLVEHRPSPLAHWEAQVSCVETVPSASASVDYSLERHQCKELVTAIVGSVVVPGLAYPTAVVVPELAYPTTVVVPELAYPRLAAA